MSSEGLYSGLYEQIRTCAILLDSVLIAVKAGESDPHDPDRQRLCAFLQELASDHPADLYIKMFSFSLLAQSVSDRSAWARMAQALQSSKVDETMVECLEAFAHIVEKERARTLEEMRGWAR